MSRGSPRENRDTSRRGNRVDGKGTDVGSRAVSKFYRAYRMSLLMDTGCPNQIRDYAISSRR